MWKSSGWAIVAAGVLMAASCGGSGGATTPTTAAPSGQVVNGTSGPTLITITSAGVNPKNITVGVGAQVTFVNNDAIEHQMYLDPHPEHTDCPDLNQVGFLTPGQSRQTGNLNTARTCGFHDHSQPSNGSLQGTITIQ